MRRAALAALLLAIGCGAPGEDSPPPAADPPATPATLPELWAAGLPAFGLFVPDERPPEARRGPDGRRLPPVHTEAGGAALAADTLLDFVFLNLEGGYDADAVRGIVTGMRSSGAPAVLVRIPPIERDGEAEARARVREVLEAGADGVVLPHVRSVEEARAAVGFFREAGADVWSPTHPSGRVIAMLMIEDPGALAQAEEIAAVAGYSLLACGIGSLTRALGGDREAAEAGNQAILAHTRRTGLANMLTASTADVAERVAQGYGALLVGGADAAEAIRKGRAAAGR